MHLRARGYLAATTLVADPPAVLVTRIVPGLEGHEMTGTELRDHAEDRTGRRRPMVRRFRREPGANRLSADVPAQVEARVHPRQERPIDRLEDRCARNRRQRWRRSACPASEEA